MDQSHRNDAKPLLPSQNVHIDVNTATTSDLVASRHSQERTASDASINKTQSKEHGQNDLNINVANDEGVPSKKRGKLKLSKENNSGQSDQNVSGIPYEIVEDSPVQIIEQSLCGAPGRNGGVPVAEDVIVISDSDNSDDIEFIPGPSARTNITRKGTKNNQFDENEASQNVHVDTNPATTSDPVASPQSRKRTASDATINNNQSNEHQQNSLNIPVPNADGVPSTKTRKIEVTQSQSEKCSSTSGKMDMTLFCQHDIVTSTPKPNPREIPIYSINHASTSQLNPIQKQSLPLSGFPYNPFKNVVKMLEVVHKLILRYAKDQNVPSMPHETVEDSSVQIIDQSLCDAQGRNGGVPVAEDVIIISDSDSDNEEEQVPTSSIYLQDCPICLEALNNKPISSTICGHIFCTPCIKRMERSRKECPTCRTRLTRTKIHPLFI